MESSQLEHLLRESLSIQLYLNFQLNVNFTISLALEKPINRMLNIVHARRSQTQSLKFLLMAVTNAGTVYNEEDIRNFVKYLNYFIHGFKLLGNLKFKFAVY